MGHVISDEDFMIHVLGNLPEEYKSKVETLENNLDNEDDRLTLDQMCIESDTKYEKICKKNNYDPENEDEKKSRRRNSHQGTALVVNGNGIFKCRCYTCGNLGHKSQQCPFRKNKNTQNTQNLQNTYSYLNEHQNKILQISLQQIIPTATYLPEGLGFQESVITVESGVINVKTAGF